MKRHAAFLMLFVVSVVLIACSQQDKSKRPSPPGTATISFADGKTITVDYSRPKVNDPKTGEVRKIFGTLVPFDKVWRTGANEATSFVTDAELMVGDIHVPAGKYTMYSIPGEKEWTIIINKQTGQWGTNYDAAQDLGRVKMAVKALEDPVETFVIAVKPAAANRGALTLTWENTEASVPVMVH